MISFDCSRNEFIKSTWMSVLFVCLRFLYFVWMKVSLSLSLTHTLKILSVHRIAVSYNCSDEFSIVCIRLLPKPQFTQFCTEAFICCLHVYVCMEIVYFDHCQCKFAMLQASWWIAECVLYYTLYAVENGQKKRSVRFQWTEHYHWMSRNKNGTNVSFKNYWNFIA